MGHKPLDLICLGRAVVDLYGEQIGSRLEDMQTLRKYAEGSSLNIATGCAHQGLNPTMLTRVGDEHMGRFLLAKAFGFSGFRPMRKLCQARLVQRAETCPRPG